MHDVMQNDPNQGQGHEPLKVANLAIFKGYLHPIYNGGWQMTTHSYSTAQYLPVMARYGRGGKRWIRYDFAQNIAIRYDIRPQNALLYVTVNSSRLMQRSH